MCAVFRFWMYWQVEASGVRTRFWDWALPDTWRSPNRSVARADRGETTQSPPAVRSPARTITHRRRYIMPHSLLLHCNAIAVVKPRLASAEAHPIAMEGDAVRHLGACPRGQKRTRRGPGSSVPACVFPEDGPVPVHFAGPLVVTE